MERKYGAWRHGWASPGKSSSPLQQTPTRQHLPWWALRTLIPDLIDGTQECRLMLTKLTKHRCIKKKRKRLYYLQWTTEESGTLNVSVCISLTVNSLLGKANYQREAWWVRKQSQWSALHGIPVQNGMRLAQQLSATGRSTCQAGWDAGRDLAGTAGQTALRAVSWQLQ